MENMKGQLGEQPKKNIDALRDLTSALKDYADKNTFISSGSGKPDDDTDRAIGIWPIVSKIQRSSGWVDEVHPDNTVYWVKLSNQPDNWTEQVLNRIRLLFDEENQRLDELQFNNIAEWDPNTNTWSLPLSWIL